VRYQDGNEARAGDVIAIDAQYGGVVVACIESGDYLPGYEHWPYLLCGIMVDTDFGGLVHYTAEATDDLVLLRRLEADMEGVGK
jgi:hypothetical protein